MASNVAVSHSQFSLFGTFEKFGSVVYFCERLDLLLVNVYLCKYFKAKSISMKVIQITFTDANLAAAEANEVICALP